MNVFLTLLLVTGAGFFFWFATVGAGKSLGKKISCPRCNRYGMKSKGASYYTSQGRKSDWECPHCGHRFTR